MKIMAGRAVWGSPSECAGGPRSVAEYVERLHGIGVNTIIMQVKGGHIFWPSRRFSEAVASGYADWDFPAVLLAECRRHNMQLHVWFVDYCDSEDGPAFRQHPEWAMRDAKGRTTADEILRGERFGSVWMCPARRPGYTDQWLVPMMREVAEMYDLDAIHHDYIRYPGDLAPDRYCFCDYCLEHIPRFCGYYYETFPNEPFHHPSYDRPCLEAHWEPGPRVLPPDWERLPREFKSRFLLHGSFFTGGLPDLDHFFYAYRMHWINECAREAAKAVRAARPGTALSAAVFKNPIHSGRFIGQDWRQFAPWVDYCMPMDYRDHFPGSVETYWALLAETIRRQMEWARDYRSLWIGVAINFLFREEELPLIGMRDRLLSSARDGVRTEFDKVSVRLRPVAPDLCAMVETWLAGRGDGQEVAHAVGAFLESPPPSYWPREKVTRTIETVREAGAEGICLFCDGHIRRYGLWDMVRTALG